MRINAASTLPKHAFSLSDAGAFGTSVQAAALGTAFGLLDQMNAHHPGTVAHSVRVARLTMAMWSAGPTWLGPHETVLLGGLLHDAGKLFIPREILNADRKLTDAEFTAMRDHPRQGAALLEELGFADAVVAAARDHHERWSGAGYPTGRPSMLLSPLSRAVAAADAFSAMIEPDRLYRRSRTVAEALAEMDACRGTQFDPTTIDLLHAAMETWRDQVPTISPPGMEPELADAVHAIGAAAIPGRMPANAMVTI
jgi:putative nucleotidyltransferase with HDIG domain